MPGFECATCGLSREFKTVAELDLAVGLHHQEGCRSNPQNDVAAGLAESVRKMGIVGVGSKGVREKRSGKEVLNQRLTLRLTSDELAKAERIGGGNAAAGVRVLLGEANAEASVLARAKRGAAYLRFAWVELKRALILDDNKNILWIQGRLKKDLKEEENLEVCSLILEALKESGD